MIATERLIDMGARLAARSGPSPLTVFDVRIDADRLTEVGAPQMLLHAKHQALMRSYQGRYVLLPTDAPASEDSSIVDRLARHYDPIAMHDLDAMRTELEDELIAPLLAEADRRARDMEAGSYVDNLLPDIRNAPPSPWLTFLETTPNREHHYRNFLIQSSADLLAEASASALGVVGEFGAPQSALFRILIDEFGYGEHPKKHSQLYRKTLSGMGLDQEYNGYWPLFDTPALEVHNAIHMLFQSPRHFFKQVGFLLFAETSYQHSTGEHYRYLKKHQPEIDGTYFGEHAHIDIHHTAMVVDEVVRPLVAKFGPEAGHEIVTGAELTRMVFERNEAHMLQLGEAFEAAAAEGAARFGLDHVHGPCVTPDTADAWRDGAVQVGGIGTVEPEAFARFPAGATGRGDERVR